MQEVKARDDVRVVVLMGGDSFFSNGIHLNTIEAAADPAKESWENINAINDVVKAVISIKDKVTVSAMRGNAGAGGVMVRTSSCTCTTTQCRVSVVMEA